VSQENVEVVEALYVAAERREQDVVFSIYDPDVELDASRITLGGLIGSPVRHGHDGVRSSFRDLHEAFDILDYEVQELIPADDFVVSLITRRGHGKASGIGVAMSYGVVFTVRAGKVTRVVWFPSYSDALKAVGLEE
jgi:ketosteroid isomerase-like protein